jgi:hypothetical protein
MSQAVIRPQRPIERRSGRHRAGSAHRDPHAIRCGGPGNACPRAFCAALHAHAQVMADLREHVYGERPMAVSEARRVACCPLSRWLTAIAPSCQDLPEYEALRRAHALFHVRATLVVVLVKAGLRAEAVAQVERGGSLRRCSASLTRAIEAFCRTVAPDPPANASVVIGTGIRHEGGTPAQ